MSAATEALLECNGLRAQVLQMTRMIERSRTELARLDLAVAAQRARADKLEPIALLALTQIASASYAAWRSTSFYADAA